MSSNQYFSFSRIGLVMKRDLMENWKTNLYRFLGPYAGFLMIMILAYWTNQNYNAFAKLIVAATAGVVWFGGIYYASCIMETMDTQEKRVSYLMLPATMLEKFVARALFVTVGFFLTAIVALVLAEATRYLFLPLFDLPEAYQTSTLNSVWHVLTNVEEVRTHAELGIDRAYMIGCLKEVAAWLWFAWGHSFFILGGCYWHKHPFWKTLGVLILISNLLGLGILLWVEAYGSSVDWEAVIKWIETNMDWITIEGMLSFVIALLSILIMLNWWLSYKVFTRTQVIKPKFRLL